MNQASFLPCRGENKWKIGKSDQKFGSFCNYGYSRFFFFLFFFVALYRCSLQRFVSSTQRFKQAMKFLVSIALLVVLVTTKGSTPTDRTIEKVPLNFAETMNSIKNSIALLDSESAKLLKDQFLQLFADKTDQPTGTVLEQSTQQQQSPPSLPSPDAVPAKSRRERRQKRQQDQKQQTQTQQLRGNAAPAPQITVGQKQQHNPQQQKQQQQQQKKSRPIISAASASETRPLFVSPSNGTDILTHPIAVIKCFNQTQCIQPKLQLVKSYDAYLCKHIGQGVRFYFLGT